MLHWVTDIEIWHVESSSCCIACSGVAEPFEGWRKWRWSIGCKHRWWHLPRTCLCFSAECFGLCQCPPWQGEAAWSHSWVQGAGLCPVLVSASWLNKGFTVLGTERGESLHRNEVGLFNFHFASCLTAATPRTPGREAAADDWVKGWSSELLP